MNIIKKYIFNLWDYQLRLDDFSTGEEYYSYHIKYLCKSFIFTNVFVFLYVFFIFYIIDLFSLNDTREVSNNLFSLFFVAAPLAIFWFWNVLILSISNDVYKQNTSHASGFYIGVSWIASMIIVLVPVYLYIILAHIVIIMN